MRKMWARMLPDAIGGDDSLAAVATGAVNFAALDREGSRIRLRLQSTAVHVRHDGDPGNSGSVLVTYVQGGKLYRVRAKAVVMGSGGWVIALLAEGAGDDGDVRVGAGGVVGEGRAGADGLVVGVGVDEQKTACAHGSKISGAGPNPSGTCAPSDHLRPSNEPW